MESIHPIVVHFPIALLISAAAIEGLALIRKREEWIRVARWNLVLGVLGAAAAVLSGREAMEAAKHSYEIHQIMRRHEQIGYLVFGLVLFGLGWRFLGRLRTAGFAAWAAWFLLAAACGGMAYGAHLGGRLVYELGVGGVYGRNTGGIEVIDPGHPHTLRVSE
jgi:uncharacterized membrane protein